MKKCYTWLGVFVFVLSISYSYAQGDKTVKGIVYDDKSRTPLVGGSVYYTFNGQLRGVNTDLEGGFTINVPIGVSSLTASLVGYDSKVFPIFGNDVFFEVYLSASASLNEVVVTALGLEREYQNLGYALQQIRGEDISEVKSVNFLDNLSGRIAGVTVSQGSSGVGSTSRISIRGESSFTNNNPLFILDGLPINNLTLVNITDDSANGFMEVDFGNGAMDINADDLESVTVLKGPAAAALYGARAANGVILLTSKKAQKEGVSVAINSSTFFERPFRLPRFQNLYGQGNSGLFEFRDGLGGGVNDNITFSFGPRLDAGLLIPQFDSPVTLPDGTVVRGADTRVHGGLPITPTPFVSNPNNLRDFYELGLTTINNVSFSGGADNFSSRFSVTDVSSQSFIPGTNLQRRSFVGALNYKPSDRLSISGNFNLINSGSDNRPATKYGSENINYSIVAWMGRQTDMSSLRDYWQPGLEGIQQYSYNYTFFDNPYFTLLENRNSFDRNRLIGNIVVSYEFNEKFSVFVRSGTETQSEERAFRRSFSSNRFPLGAYAEQNLTYQETNTDFLATYSDTFGDISFDFSVGGNRMDQQASMDQLQTLQLAQPGIFTFANAASPLQYFQSFARKRINSAYAFARTSYKDFLYLDITSRTDWSSALANEFGTNATSFSYPSIATSLLLSNVLQLPRSINLFKLRASYAEVGNDSAPFQTIGNFTSRTPVYANPSFGDQSVIPNANLRPERINSWEIGTDIRLFSNRISIDLTYFNMLTKDQIISLPIPISSGYDRQNVNGGAVRTFGYEATIDYKAIRTSKLFWNIQANYTRYVNRVESLPGGSFTLAYNRIYDNVNQTVWYIVSEGGRLGDMWGTGYLRNENGDFIINSQGGYITDNTLIKLGNMNPDFLVGIHNYISFKNFHVSALVDVRKGGQIVSRTTALAGAGGQLIETVNRPEEGIVAKGVVNIGSADSPVFVANTTPIPAETFYRQFYDRNNEENNTFDADFIKLRELSIGMDLPYSLLKNRSRHMNVSIIGRNLFMLSKIKHFDPEQVAFQGQNVLGGVEDMAYPTARSMGFKFSLNF
ncbi:SusC/RagA family TonB-linked outer membrane protein [Mongoliitalea lutea]|uniref:SusC/RagA family TonB-linked outer membrane protein n=1 Tax=Mongoliitalea lutea TaxID=849756 RepID=A0A8J3D1K5_9BACT|nr:SusC/RagA family TonB-linked outer membrane protein [Mongoliitalea lutea]GHB49518.1 SusC/RagA family TonB-linked outer membrane protein [Mongoliitalea lutea]